METLTATSAITSTASITKTKLAVTAAVMFLVGGAAAFAAIGSLPSLQNLIKVPVKTAPQKITTPTPTPAPVVKGGGGPTPVASCSSTLVVAKNPTFTDKTRTNPTGAVNDNARAVASFTVYNCSNEDVSLNGTMMLGDTYRDNFPTTCASTYLKSMTVKDGSGTQMTNKITTFPSCAPGAAGRSSAYVLTLPTPYIVRKGQTIALTVLSDLKAALDPAAALLSFNGLRATGAASGHDYSQWLQTLPLQTVEISGFNSSTPAAPFLTQSCKIFSNCTTNGFDVPSGAGIFDNIGEYFINMQRLNAGETVDLSSITFHLEGPYIGTHVGDDQVSVQVHLNGALVGTATVTGVDNGTSNKATLTLSPNQHLIYDPANAKSMYFEVDSVENDFKALPGEKKSLRAVVDQFDWSDQSSSGPITANVPATTRDDLRIFTGQAPALNFTFVKDPNFTAKPIPPGATGAPIAQFLASSTESIDLRTVAISFVMSNPDLLLGFNILVNGRAAWSGAPNSAGTSAGALLSLPLTTPITFVTNQQNIITIQGQFSPQAPGGATISTVLDLTAVKRAMVTLPVDPNVDPVTSDPATIQATLPVGALRVTTLPTPAAHTVVPGAQGETLATFELNPGVVSSGENIIVQGVTITRSGFGANSDIQDLFLYDDRGSLLAMKTGVANSNPLSFRNSITIPKTGSTVLTLKGDISPNATGGATHKFAVVAPNDVNDWGQETANFIPPTIVDNGQFITIATTTTTPTTTISALWSSDTPSGASSPSASQVIGKIIVNNPNTTAVEVSRFIVDIAATFSATSNRNLTVYADSLNASPAGQLTIPAGSLTNKNYLVPFANNVTISPGNQKTFFITLDTSDAHMTDSLSVRTAFNWLSFNSMLHVTSIDLYKTFVY